MGGGRGSILIRTPEAQSRGVVSRGGTIWDEKERISGRPAFVIQKVLEVGIGRWVCVRCKGEEGISRPPFIKGVVVLYGPQLRDSRLVVIWRTLDWSRCGGSRRAGLR